MVGVIALEFDGTVVLNDVRRAVFERFVPADWRGVEVDCARKGAAVEETNAALVDLLAAEPAEIASFSRSIAEARPGLRALLDWADANGWLASVVSVGFDAYIDPILDGLSVGRVARHCGRTQKQYRWRVRYLSPRGIEILAGFALSYVRAFQAAGDFVVYAGSSAAGEEAARVADAVFARGDLLDLLGERGQRVYSFETLEDVRATLEVEGAGWLEPVPSQAPGREG